MRCGDGECCSARAWANEQLYGRRWWWTPVGRSTRQGPIEALDLPVLPRAAGLDEDLSDP